MSAGGLYTFGEAFRGADSWPLSAWQRREAGEAGSEAVGVVVSTMSQAAVDWSRLGSWRRRRCRRAFVSLFRRDKTSGSGSIIEGRNGNLEYCED